VSSTTSLEKRLNKLVQPMTLQAISDLELEKLIVASKRRMTGKPLTVELEELLEKYQAMRIDSATVADLPSGDEIQEAFPIEQTQEIGLALPKAVTDATAEYFAEEYIFQQWMDDKCEVGPDKWETPTLLFNSWKTYADAGRFPVGNQKSFSQRLQTAGFSQKRDGTRGRYYPGIKCHQERQDDWRNDY